MTGMRWYSISRKRIAPFSSDWSRSSGQSRNAQCAEMRGARCEQTKARYFSRCSKSETREHLAVARQPLDPVRTVHALAVVVPGDGVGAAEAVQGVLRLPQRKVVGVDLHVQQYHVGVVEKVQIDVRDVQCERRIVRRGGEPHRSHVVATKYPHRRGDRLGRPRAAPHLAVEKALDVGQEGDELRVVPFLELRWISRELVRDLAPGILAPVLLEQFPVLLDLSAARGSA